MSRKNVRVDVPIGKVDGSLTLGKSIKKKHDQLMVDVGSSPLIGLIDVTQFEALLTSIGNNRTPAVTDTRQKEAWNEQALSVIGIAAGQNLQVMNTVYWHINKVHKFMAFKFKGNEEQASLWGFDVVVTEKNGRKNVSFNVPYRSPQGLLDLATDIISKHTTDGATSILPAFLFDMADMTAKNNLAIQLREDAETKNQNAQAGNQLARNLCGYGEGQTSQTPDTLFWYLTQIRDLLLIVHQGNEEQLSTWGFNVVVSSSTSHGPGSGPKPVVLNLAGGETAALMQVESADQNIMVSVSGGNIELCVGESETVPCSGPTSMILNDGEHFEGTITELGLGSTGFLKATNVTDSSAQVIFLKG